MANETAAARRRPSRARAVGRGEGGRGSAVAGRSVDRVFAMHGLPCRRPRRRALPIAAQGEERTASYQRSSREGPRVSEPGGSGSAGALASERPSGNQFSQLRPSSRRERSEGTRRNNRRVRPASSRGLVLFT